MSGDLAADTRIVAFWTLVSRLTGFGRVAVVAAVLGPTYFGNLLQTLLLLPYVICELLGNSLIPSILAPRVIGRLELGDRRGARRLVDGFLGLLLVALAATGLGCAAAAPLVLPMMTAAVEDAAIRAAQMAVGWPLMLAVLPQVLFYGVAGTATAVLNAHGCFKLAASAPALENIAVIAVFCSFALFFDAGVEVTAIDLGAALVVGLGCTAAVGLRAAAVWFGTVRLGSPIVPRIGWRDPDVRRLMALGVPSSGTASLSAICYFALLVVAGSIPGGAIAFQIGYQFLNLPVALGARPVASALLPRLAQAHSRHTMEAFHRIYRSGVSLALFVAVPASLLMTTSSGSLAGAVTFGEMSTAEGLALVAAAIGGLGVGILGESLMIVATSASYARGDAARPFRAMCLRVSCIAAGIAPVAWLTTGGPRLWVLGLVVSTANLLAGYYLHRSETRSLPAVPGQWLPGLAATAAASAIAAAAAAIVATQLQLPANVFGGSVVIATASLLYLGVQWLRGAEELRALLLGSPGGAPPRTETAASGTGMSSLRQEPAAQQSARRR